MNHLLRTANLTDTIDRLILADALTDAGRDDEADLLRTDTPVRLHHHKIEPAFVRNTFLAIRQDDGTHTDKHGRAWRVLDDVLALTDNLMAKATPIRGTRFTRLRLLRWQDRVRLYSLLS